MYVIYWGYEDESDAGVVVPPDDAAVCVGDVGGEEGDVVRLPEERHAVERGQQRERNLNSKIWMGVLFTYMYYTKSWVNGAMDNGSNCLLVQKVAGTEQIGLSHRKFAWLMVQEILDNGHQYNFQLISSSFFWPSRR